MYRVKEIVAVYKEMARKMFEQDKKRGYQSLNLGLTQDEEAQVESIRKIQKTLKVLIDSEEEKENDFIQKVVDAIASTISRGPRSSIQTSRNKSGG